MGCGSDDKPNAHSQDTAASDDGGDDSTPNDGDTGQPRDPGSEPEAHDTGEDSGQPE